MGELYNPYPKLPKNIRQIGERDQVVKLYMEDYVNTYLKRLYPTGGQDLKVGLLLGNSEQHEGTPYLFIDGAVEMDDVTKDGGQVDFTENAWKKVYEDIEQFFPKRTVLGWFLCTCKGSQLSPLNYWKEHVKYFPEKNQVMYLNSGLEGEEALYITSDEGFYKLRGHSIYYERNQMMQDYMILRGGNKRAESGGQDNVVRDFRQRVESRKSEVKARKNAVGALGSLCCVLAVAVLASGITLFNNYEKMRKMESVMASVLPDNVKNWEDYQPENADKFVVEEISGQVYPTEENESYTMSSTWENSWNGSGAGQTGANGQTGTGGADGSGQNGSQNGNSGTAGTDANGQNSGQTNGQAGNSGQTGTGTGGQNSGQNENNGAGGTDANGQTNGQAGIGGQTGNNGTVGADGTGAGVQNNGQNGNNGTGGEAEVVAIPDVYVVQKGETLRSISLKFYHSIDKIDEICRLNGLEDPNKINSGQKLILP